MWVPRLHFLQDLAAHNRLWMGEQYCCRVSCYDLWGFGAVLTPVASVWKKNLPDLTFAPEWLEPKLLSLKTSADFIPSLFDFVNLGKWLTLLNFNFLIDEIFWKRWDILKANNIIGLLWEFGEIFKGLLKMLVLEKYLLTFAISIILMAYPLYCTVERISLLESHRFGFQYCFVIYSLYNVRKITLPVQAFFFSSLNKKMEMMVSGRIFTFFFSECGQ